MLCLEGWGLSREQKAGQKLGDAMLELVNCLGVWSTACVLVFGVVFVRLVSRGLLFSGSIWQPGLFVGRWRRFR